MEATDTVGELLTLQEIDVDILRITEQLAALDEELAQLREEVEEFDAGAQKALAEKEEAEGRVRTFQRSVEAGRATLKRLEARTASVVNMQQHFAVRTETDTARRNLRTAEEEALDAMQDVESASSRLAGIELARAEASTTLEAREREAAGTREQLEAELASRTGSKEEQERRLDLRALRLYHSVRGGRAASALAALTTDGACGNCFTAIPKQRRADIRAGRELAVCEGCGVILYSDPAED